MAKFSGFIGYKIMEEKRPGVWLPKHIRKSYKGDLLKNYRNTQASSSVNDDVTISNDISIVGDTFAKDNIFNMVYVEFMGVQWKVRNVDASTYPRLVISLGGVYNGEKSTDESK